MALLCIVYWVCLIALCPNQRVQAGRARVHRDKLCCGLSQRAKNIHSACGSEGGDQSIAQKTHANTHIVRVIHLCTRDHMVVHKCWGVYLRVCVVGIHVCLHVTDNYPLCDFAFHSRPSALTMAQLNTNHALFEIKPEYTSLATEWEYSKSKVISQS